MASTALKHQADKELKELTTGFVGLTPLGIVAAAAAAAKGSRVVAFDDDFARTAALKRGELPIREPGLEALIETGRERIDYSATAADLGRCDVIYICADVFDEKGASDLSPLKTLLANTAAAARAEAVIALRSQVPPGFTRINAPKSRTLFCQVELPGAGNAVERALKPAGIAIGCADPSLPLPAVLAASLGNFGCPILPMRYESAELVRMSHSVLLAASDSAAAMLAELCEKCGADWSEIEPALKLDPRIGSRTVVTPGLGLSDDLERDLAAIQKLAGVHKVDAEAVEAWLTLNYQRRNWVLERLEEHVLSRTPDAHLTLFGLTGEPSTRRSAALALVAALPRLRIRAFDPAAVKLDLPDNVELITDAFDACGQADALVILSPRPEFRIDPAELASRMRGTVVVDPHGLLDAAACRRSGLTPLVLGQAPSA